MIYVNTTNNQRAKTEPWSHARPIYFNISQTQSPCGCIYRQTPSNILPITRILCCASSAHQWQRRFSGWKHRKHRCSLAPRICWSVQHRTADTNPTVVAYRPTCSIATCGRLLSAEKTKTHPSCLLLQVQAPFIPPSRLSLSSSLQIVGTDLKIAHRSFTSHFLPPLLVFQYPVQTFQALPGNHPCSGISVLVVFRGSCSWSVRIANATPTLCWEDFSTHQALHCIDTGGGGAYRYIQLLMWGEECLLAPLLFFIMNYLTAFDFENVLQTPHFHVHICQFKHNWKVVYISKSKIHILKTSDTHKWYTGKCYGHCMSCTLIGWTDLPIRLQQTLIESLCKVGKPQKVIA